MVSEKIRLKGRKIRESVGQIYSLDGPLNGLEERISKDFKRAVETHSDLSIEQEYVGYDGGSHFELYGTRPMTEKEILADDRAKAKERADEERAKVRKELGERQELKRLREKYGDA